MRLARAFPVSALALWLASSALATQAAGAIEVTSPEILKLRDPFRMPEIKNADVLPKTELEGFAVDQLRLTGVLVGGDRVRAMLIGPNGKTYFVSTGTKVGTRSGVVRQITSEAVMVKEKIVNVLGQEEEVDSEIKLVSNPKLGTVGQ